MTFEEKLSSLLDPVTPTLKRQEGYLDARAGKPPLSDDADYRAGYSVGEGAKAARTDNSSSPHAGGIGEPAA